MNALRSFLAAALALALPLAARPGPATLRRGGRAGRCSRRATTCGSPTTPRRPGSPPRSRGERAMAGRPMYLTWNIDQRHGLRVLAAPFSITETGVPGTAVEFAGPATARGRHRGTYKLTRTASPGGTGSGTVRAGPGGSASRPRSATRTSPCVKQHHSRKTDLGFVPLLHLAADGRLAPRWHLILDVDALAGGRAGRGRGDQGGLRRRPPLDRRRRLPHRRGRRGRGRRLHLRVAPLRGAVGDVPLVSGGVRWRRRDGRKPPWPAPGREASRPGSGRSSNGIARPSRCRIPARPPVQSGDPRETLRTSGRSSGTGRRTAWRARSSPRRSSSSTATRRCSRSRVARQARPRPLPLPSPRPLRHRGALARLRPARPQAGVPHGAPVGDELRGSVRGRLRPHQGLRRLRSPHAAPLRLAALGAERLAVERALIAFPHQRSARPTSGTARCCGGSASSSASIRKGRWISTRTGTAGCEGRRAPMSDRSMWKMLHLLYTLRPGQDGLTDEELSDAGIDCGPDTIQPLTSSGVVARVGGRYGLTEPVRRILGTCVVANRRWSTDDMWVDHPSCSWSCVQGTVVRRRLPGVDRAGRGDAGLACIRVTTSSAWAISRRTSGRPSCTQASSWPTCPR